MLLEEVHRCEVAQLEEQVQVRRVLERIEARHDVRVRQAAMQRHLCGNLGDIDLTLQKHLGGDRRRRAARNELSEQVGPGKGAAAEAVATKEPRSRPQLAVGARQALGDDSLGRACVFFNWLLLGGALSAHADCGAQACGQRGALRNDDALVCGPPAASDDSPTGRPSPHSPDDCRGFSLATAERRFKAARARAAAQPVQGVWRRWHLRARSVGQPVQGVCGGSGICDE